MRVFKPIVHHIATGAAEHQEHGVLAGTQLHADVPGEAVFYAAEVALVAATPEAIILEDPVRTVRVTNLGANLAYIAKQPSVLGTVATGGQAERVAVPAGATVELPWHQDEIHAVSTAGTTIQAIGLI